MARHRRVLKVMVLAVVKVAMVPHMICQAHQHIMAVVEAVDITVKKPPAV